MGWFGKLSETEQRKRKARLLYDFEVECRRQGWGVSAFIYEEQKHLFKWTDGRCAFSQEHADWKLLWTREHRADHCTGWVLAGYTGEGGAEREVSYRCRPCPDSR